MVLEEIKIKKSFFSFQNSSHGRSISNIRIDLDISSAKRRTRDSFRPTYFCFDTSPPNLCQAVISCTARYCRLFACDKFASSQNYRNANSVSISTNAGHFAAKLTPFLTAVHAWCIDIQCSLSRACKYLCLHKIPTGKRLTVRQLFRMNTLN